MRQKSAVDVARGFIQIANEQIVDIPETGQKVHEGLTHLKLQKLLYFAQAAHLAIHGEPLFTDEIQAWAFGPVVPTVYREFAKYESGLIPAEEAATLPDDVKLFLEEVWKIFGKYSATELVNLSHSVGPWSLLYKEGERGTVIPNEAIKVAFEKVFIAFDEREQPQTQMAAS